MTRVRLWLLPAALVAGLLVAGCGSENAPKNVSATVTVKNAKPVGGIKKINVKKGGHVHFVVNSDTADEIHIHGYDLMKDVTKGGTITFDFAVPNDGAFEIELESRKVQIADLRVLP
ncbi:MAG: hypothetical protein QOD53_2026 [Thermoleophilaceae bacterium]|jgi:hypothetical protein|nr:hypothetical protein [Thermoleophilaceae bacterium]